MRLVQDRSRQVRPPGSKRGQVRVSMEDLAWMQRLGVMKEHIYRRDYTYETAGSTGDWRWLMRWEWLACRVEVGS